jgi:Ig-like domain-containing protein
MSESPKYRVLAVIASFVLIASACGSSAQQDSAISTAVAQTMQAQQTVSMSTAPVRTDTPAPAASSPATVTGAPLTQVAPGLCNVSASLVGETIPDGTILQPGAIFTKVWKIQNIGTCTWNSSWQLAFYGGDQMDGLIVYNFPEPAQPGETLEIPIILRAPTGDGIYTGEWMLKSPWGVSFGVGQYNAPISVSIVVGSATPENKNTLTVYGVTAVTYQVDRRCDPANTFYTITVFITTNGPARVVFTWHQSDGNDDRNNRLNFTEASTQSAQREWIQHSRNSSPNRRWVKVTINSPSHQEFDSVLLPKLCGQV